MPENKRPDDLVQHVIGVMKSATDPEFGNSFTDLVQQIENEELSEYAIKEHEDITIEVPLVFYGRAKLGGGDGHLKLASIGGEHCIMTDEEKAGFTKNRLFMRLKQKENECQYLQNEIERLEKALMDTNFYEHEPE